MKTKILVALLSVTCMSVMLAGLSIAQDQTGGANSNGNSNRNSSMSARQGFNSADAKFAMTAGMDGMTEVELGRLAVQKGTSDAVKQFGQRMIDDHTAANQQLMQLTSAKGITLPASLDAKHASMVQKFQGMSGAAFDRAYAKQMVQDHKKAVSLFQKEAGRGMDADMKAFASSTLPTLQGHLSMAQAMSGSTGGSSMNGNMNSNMNSNRNMSGGGNANGNMNSSRDMTRNSNGNMSGNANGNMNSNRRMGGNSNANNSNRK